MQIKKNRFDGERGDVGYIYDRINHVVEPVQIHRKKFSEPPVNSRYG